MDEPVATDLTRRLSRPCYNKPHRCPGWAGGGTRSAKVYRCEDGYVRVNTGDPVDRHPGTHPFRFGRCNECGVTTWPYAIRWIDPRYVFGWKVRDIQRDLRWRFNEWHYWRSK